MATNDRRERRDPPLNGPDVPPEQKRRQLAGDREPEDQGAIIDADDIENLGELTQMGIYQGELEAGVDDDLPDDPENLEMLTELELRDGETDDPMEAVEEGLTYVPPMDPPVVPGGGRENAEVASGLGSSALEEPYDADHHDSFLNDDDEMSARVREAIRADSSTTQYAGRISIETREGVVTLRGTVDDLLDVDNLVGVAGYAEGVEEVVDELKVRGMD